MLNLYQLQMFLAVVDSGSFSAAAAQLHVTQPAVSEGVRALEARLGMHLFDRRGHRAALTPEGAALIDSARHLLALAEQAEQDILRQRGILSGALRLATATLAGAPVLAGRLGAFAHTHAGVRSGLVMREPGALLDGLRSGEFDAGFLAERPRSGRLAHLLVAVDEWVFVAPPGHPWLAAGAAPPAPEVAPPVKRKRGRPPGRLSGPAPAHAVAALPLDRLRDEGLVLESGDSLLGGLARRDLRDALEDRGLPGHELRPVLELITPVQVLRAVEQGAGVGVLQLSQLEGYQGPAVLFRLEGKPLTRQLFAVRDPRVALSPVTAAWWEFLTAHSPGGEE